MQKTEALKKELTNLGCVCTTTKTKYGYTTKVVFPYPVLKAKNKNFDPHPCILTYYHGTEEILRLQCCNSPTGYGINSVDALIRYYAFMVKTNNPQELPLKPNSMLTSTHTVNTVLRAIDLACWRKGYFLLMVNHKTKTVKVIANGNGVRK